MAASIVMLDCQRMFVQGMKSYFGSSASQYSLVDSVCTAADLYAIIEESTFDYLVMDLNVPDKDGMEVISHIKEVRPEMMIVVLSAYSEVRFVKDAMVNGADAYVSKMSTMSELSYALQEVANGNTYIGDGLRTSPASRNTRHDQKRSSGYEDGFMLKNKLTPREVEILELLTQGMKSRAIATQLFISDQTVGVHRKNIMKKLGIRNTAALIKFALENHLV